MPHTTRTPLATVVALLVAAALASTLSGCARTASARDAGRPIGTATSDAPVELRVSAASSLARVLARTARPFEVQQHVKLVFNLGASGLLQKQIEAGAPADVFVSAGPAQVATLAAEGFLSTDTASAFAGNDLVVMVPKGNPAGIHGPEDLSKAAHIVTGNPATAPHGAKANEWLTGIGLWDGLRPRIVFAENAAQTLDYVARGEADAGIGFASEAKGSGEVEIVYTVPKGEIAPVRYVAAPLVGSGHVDLAARYVTYLSSPDVQKALVNAGFLPAPPR